jgi:hypothetical protein
MDNAYKTWYNNLEEYNLEDGALVLEQLETSLFKDDDQGEMPPPSIAMVTLIRTLIEGASCPGSYSWLPLAPLPEPHGGCGCCDGAQRKEK